jgi:hypothetical protein
LAVGLTLFSKKVGVFTILRPKPYLDLKNDAMSQTNKFSIVVGLQWRSLSLCRAKKTSFLVCAHLFLFIFFLGGRNFSLCESPLPTSERPSFAKIGNGVTSNYFRGLEFRGVATSGVSFQKTIVRLLSPVKQKHFTIERLA